MNKPPEDEPPSYEKVVNPEIKFKTPPGEIPPVYTHLPEKEKATPQRSFWRRHRSWFILLIIGIIASIGAVTGGVVDSNSQARAEAAAKLHNFRSLENTTTLASAECGAGSFIFFQANTSIINIKGQFRNRYPSIPGNDYVTTTLNMTGDAKPMLGTSLTAVCSSNSTSPGARIYLYYFSERQFNYVLYEVIFSLTYSIDDFNYPTPLSTFASVRELSNHSSPASLSAIYVPSEGPRIYHFALGTAGLTYLLEIRSQSSLNSNSTHTSPSILASGVRGIRAPLAAAVAEPYPNDATGFQEINVYYGDSDGHLCRIMYERSIGWHRVQKMATSTSYLNASMSKLTAVIPHVYDNITVPLLYYISNKYVNQVASSVPLGMSRNTTSANFTAYDPNPLLNFPTAVTTPGLIAASTWNERWNRSVSVDALGNHPDIEGIASLHVVYAKPYGVPENLGGAVSVS